MKFAYGADDMIWYLMVTIGIGEVLAVGVMGQFLMSMLSKYRNILFGDMDA